MARKETRHLEKYKVLGEAITSFRKMRGMTQEELAERLDISRQHLSAIEAPNTFRPPSFELLCKIADVLEIDLYWLFQFPDWDGGTTHDYSSYKRNFDVMRNLGIGVSYYRKKKGLM